MQEVLTSMIMYTLWSLSWTILMSAGSTNFNHSTHPGSAALFSHWITTGQQSISTLILGFCEEWTESTFCVELGPSRRGGGFLRFVPVSIPLLLVLPVQISGETVSDVGFTTFACKSQGCRWAGLVYFCLNLWEIDKPDTIEIIQWERLGKYQPYPVRTFKQIQMQNVDFVHFSQNTNFSARKCNIQGICLRPKEGALRQVQKKLVTRPLKVLHFLCAAYRYGLSHCMTTEMAEKSHLMSSFCGKGILYPN